MDPFPGLSAAPATKHPYIYALDDPLRYTDPTGRFDPQVILEYLQNTQGPNAVLYYEAWSSDEVFWDMLVTAQVGDSLFSPFVGRGVFTAGEPFGFVGEQDLCAYQGHGPYTLRRGEDDEVVESRYMRKGGSPMHIEHNLGSNGDLRAWDQPIYEYRPGGAPVFANTYRHVEYGWYGVRLNALGSDDLPAIIALILSKEGPKWAAKLGIPVVSIPLLREAAAVYSAVTLVQDVVTVREKLWVRIEPAWTWPLLTPEPRPAPAAPSQ